MLSEAGTGEAALAGQVEQSKSPPNLMSRLEWGPEGWQSRMGWELRNMHRAAPG